MKKATKSTVVVKKLLPKADMVQERLVQLRGARKQTKRGTKPYVVLSNIIMEHNALLSAIKGVSHGK